MKDKRATVWCRGGDVLIEKVALRAEGRSHEKFTGSSLRDDLKVLTRGIVGDVLRVGRIEKVRGVVRDNFAKFLRAGGVKNSLYGCIASTRQLKSMPAYYSKGVGLDDTCHPFSGAVKPLADGVLGVPGGAVIDAKDERVPVDMSASDARDPDGTDDAGATDAFESGVAGVRSLKAGTI